MSRSTRTQKFRQQVEEEWSQKNPNVAIEIEDDPWDWSLIACNPNLTMRFIIQRCEMEEEQEKQGFLEKRTREYMAAHKIKQWWKGVYYSPYTEVGKRRLLKEYQELFGNLQEQP